ncbi:MAG: hypothetical protein KA368_19040, partial [Acidobacteria bacterium]|nr:hypothetical protein [Acidobacteriota bacterium]
VVVLGSTGRNFAAGMSGGVAYVLDETGGFSDRCNREMVSLGLLIHFADEGELELVRGMIERHAEYTGSRRAQEILDNWAEWLPRFIRVMPNDYKRVLDAQRQMRAAGLSEEEAVWAAFELNSADISRAGGK